jgi:hypothetical protein
MIATCQGHLNLDNLIILMIFGKEWQLWISTLCSIQHPSITPSLLGPTEFQFPRGKNTSCNMYNLTIFWSGRYISIYLTICLSVYRSIYLSMALQSFVGHWPLLQFLDPIQSVGLLGRAISRSIGRHVRTEQRKHRINAHRHPCLERDSNARSQRSKTVHALDREATVIRGQMINE